jgi:hypothetical protein
VVSCEQKVVDVEDEDDNLLAISEIEEIIVSRGKVEAVTL